MKANPPFVLFGDTHLGCRLGLCPPEGCAMDNGPTYYPSPEQQRVWLWWDEFWHDWLPARIGAQRAILIHGGDAEDGTHHDAVTPISHNLEDQRKLALAVLRPVIAERADLYYHIRGTRAHSGTSGQREEGLARELGAVPDANGQSSRYSLELRTPAGIIQASHHLSASSALASTFTAIWRECYSSLYYAADRGVEPPALVVRHHVHREAYCRRGRMHGMCVGGWQLKTPYTYTVSTGAVSVPEFSASLVTIKEGDFHVETFKRTIERGEIDDISHLFDADGGRMAAGARGGNGAAQRRGHDGARDRGSDADGKDAMELGQNPRRAARRGQARRPDRR